MSLFDFKAYIDSLLEDKNKKEVVEKYTNLVEDITKIEKVEDTIFYKNYVHLFPTFDYLVPIELKDDFEWNLLLQLATSSLSTKVSVEYNKEKTGIEVIITVVTNDTKVTKKVSELWSFQVLRLFEIFIEEGMNLESLAKEGESEKKGIQTQRKQRLHSAKRNKLLVDKFNFLNK